MWEMVLGLTEGNVVLVEADGIPVEEGDWDGVYGSGVEQERTVEDLMGKWKEEEICEQLTERSIVGTRNAGRDILRVVASMEVGMGMKT